MISHDELHAAERMHASTQAGQGLPLPIYARNIWMIYRDRLRVAA